MPKDKPWYQQKDFLALRFEWYERLKREGFRDVEYHSYSDGSALPVMRGYSPMDAVRFYKPDQALLYSLMRGWQTTVEQQFGKRSWQAAYWADASEGLSPNKIRAKHAKRIDSGKWPSPSSVAVRRMMSEAKAAMLAAHEAEEPEYDPQTVGYDVSGRLENSRKTASGPAREIGQGAFAFLWDDPSWHDPVD